MAKRVLASLLVLAAVSLLAPLSAFADGISFDDFDQASTLRLRVGGAPWSTTLRFRRDPGTGFCRILETQNLSISVGVISGNTGVARVSSSPALLRSCNDQVPLSIWPVGEGETDFAVTVTLNGRFGSFQVFRTNVHVVVEPGGDPGGGGGIIPGGLNPASTPELGSLALFASGAAGLGGYALARWRAKRGRGGPD